MLASETVRERAKKELEQSIKIVVDSAPERQREQEDDHWFHFLLFIRAPSLAGFMDFLEQGFSNNQRNTCWKILKRPSVTKVISIEQTMRESAYKNTTVIGCSIPSLIQAYFADFVNHASKGTGREISFMEECWIQIKAHGCGSYTFWSSESSSISQSRNQSWEYDLFFWRLKSFRCKMMVQ